MEGIGSRRSQVSAFQIQIAEICNLRIEMDLKTVHVLVGRNNGILPVQPGGGRFDGFGFTVFDHLFQDSELIAAQTILFQSLSPALEDFPEFIFHYNKYTITLALTHRVVEV
jgi:hypothetical protein